MTKLTLIAVTAGERAVYVDLPGFALVGPEQEIPLGRVELPVAEAPDGGA